MLIIRINVTLAKLRNPEADAVALHVSKSQLWILIFTILVILAISRQNCRGYIVFLVLLERNCANPLCSNIFS